MPATLHSTAGGLWAEQPADARLDYVLDWDLGEDTIASSTWQAIPNTVPLTISGQDHDGTRTTCLLSGGAPGSWYAVTNTIQTAGGRADSRTFMLLVSGSLPLAGASALFPFPPAAVAAVRRSRLVALAKTHLAGLDLPDDVIWGKLLGAEAAAERELRVWLTPREVLPAAERYDADAAALVALGHKVEREPGYHYHPSMFSGDRWGMLELRARPISRIHLARFAYPLPDTTVIDLPRDWLRAEGNTNRVNIVPTTTPFAAPINSFILSALGGGRTVPYMLQIAYRAGIEDVRARLPDLPSVVERMAALTLVEDLLLPQSGSISADGLSQSLSWEAEKHRELTLDKLAAMRDGLHGVRVTII